jgi:soluble lytic murein transglycosylase
MFGPFCKFLLEFRIIDISIIPGIVSGMKFERTILPLILSIMLVSCNLPVKTEVPLAATQEPIIDQPILTSSPNQEEVTQTQDVVPDVAIEKADQLFFYGDWEAALREYQDAFEGTSTPQIQAAALLAIGRTRYQMGNYPESLQTLSQLIESYPDFTQRPAAYFALAQTQEALENYAGAAEAYANYLTLRPGIIDSYLQERRGDALASAGNHLAAIDVYQAALQAPRLDESLGIELKIANAYAAIGDHQTALVAYQDIYTRTTSDYTKASLDFLLGQSYTQIGDTERAYAAYLNAVENFPLSYDSYQGLIILVEAGYPVSEFDRGLVDYYAGQYNLSIAAFDRYLAAFTERAGKANFYKGLAYLALDDPDSAIASWDVLIQSYPDDPNWEDAWEEKAFTQWAYLEQYQEARQTLLNFVDQNPLHASAPQFLFDAARIAERAGDYELAASIWARIPPEYPSSDLVSRAIFLAGLSDYRAGEFASGLASFQWLLNSTADPENKSAALFWIAKSHQALGDTDSAQAFWQQTADADPTGYYSERARDILLGRPPFDPPLVYDLVFDVRTERQAAEEWMRAMFAIPAEVDLTGLGPLLSDARIIRGTELWDLGLYEEARLEFESMRVDLSNNPMDCYRLLNYLLDLGLYRSAVLASRQVLDLQGMDDAGTMNAPAYFNHIRFGSYYRDLVLSAAQVQDFHPLFLFSVVRQESLYEGFVRSSAGARGLMQIIPSTGEDIAANLGWPTGYTSEDLYRPLVSITLGADYLDRQRDYFEGDLFAALAAYNAGPGNAAVWKDFSGGDPDLFLEIIRFDETRQYIKGIYEIFSIYRRLYDRTP